MHIMNQRDETNLVTQTETEIRRNEVRVELGPGRAVLSLGALSASLMLALSTRMLAVPIAGVLATLLVLLFVGFALSLLVVVFGGLFLFEARRRGATFRSLSLREWLCALGVLCLFVATLLATVYAEWLAAHHSSQIAAWYQAALGLMLLLVLAYIALRIFWTRRKPPPQAEVSI